MLCKKCGGPSSVYRTKTSARIDIRDRRCEKCGEGWETTEKETPGTRYTFTRKAAGAPPERQETATNSTPVAPAQQSGGAPVANGGRGGLPPDQSSNSGSRSGSDLDSGLADLPAGARAIAERVRRKGLCAIFGEVRAAEVGGLAWQSVNASRKAGEMMGVIGEDEAALADVPATMALLFQNAKAGKYQRSTEVLNSATFAFGVWCSEFTPLREQLHGKAEVLPARRPPNRAEGTVTSLTAFLAKGSKDDA